MKVKFSNFEGNHIYKYNDEFQSLMTRKCKCGHSVTIYSRHRREICSNCGAYVFLTKKDEFEFKLRKKLMK